MQKGTRSKKEISKDWFSSEEAKERREKIEKSSKVLSASMSASLKVNPVLLKSKISV